MKILPLLCCLTGTALSSAPAWAEASAGPAAPSAGGLLQVILGLALVLLLLWGSLYLLKRLQTSRGVGAGQIKVIGGTAVGPRERVVLVEVGDTWLVLGVAPGRVNSLHSLPRQNLTETTTEASLPEKDFASWLKQIMERRHEP